MEVWKDVVGAEKFYEVSSHGRIRNKITNDILKPSKSGDYRHIKLKYGINKDVLIHRIVAEAFIPNPFNFRCVNHIDENKENNCADNLEWCTYQYNCTYGNGALKRNSRIIQKDVMNHVVKGTKPDWCPIKEMPSRKQVPGCFFMMDEVYGKEIGFNDCLDEIEGR